MAIQSAYETSPFQRTQPCIANNDKLREPQQAAYQAVVDHFSRSQEPALVQIPVGCGKTGLMSILPFGIARKRVLIVAPNVTIRDAIFQAVDSASERCFWRASGVSGMSPEGPFAAKIDGQDALLSDCVQSHFVVTNVQQIGTARNRWLEQFPADFFDLVLIDEGHHNAAASWRRLFTHFSQAKIISLTATPFRSDGQKVLGKRIYSYSFLRAMARSYIKTLRAIHVAPCELSFTFRDESRTCTLDEVLELREEQWFSRGVALAEECNRHIVAASIEQCEQQRSARGFKHQIIAAACSVEHAAQVASLYREAGYVAQEIHSQQTKTERKNILARLKDGRLDAIIQVQMLGEGFDHPPLSIAAVFRPFRTLSPYIQFVGRIMRVVRAGRPGDVDNQGLVVSHVGLNTERHWKDFQQLDKADQELWAGLAGSESVVVRPSGGEEDGPLREPRTFSPDMLVAWEVVGELQQNNYDNASTPPEQLPLELKVGEGQAVIAGPQQRRRESKSLLQQQVNDTIRNILYRSRLHPQGRQLSSAIPFLRRLNNWAALRLWLYTELNQSIDRKPGTSKTWSLAEIERALDALPGIVTKIEARLASCIRRKPQWPKSANYSSMSA